MENINATYPRQPTPSAPSACAGDTGLKFERSHLSGAPEPEKHLPFGGTETKPGPQVTGGGLGAADCGTPPAPAPSNSEASVVIPAQLDGSGKPENDGPSTSGSAVADAFPLTGPTPGSSALCPAVIPPGLKRESRAKTRGSCVMITHPGLDWIPFGNPISVSGFFVSGVYVLNDQWNASSKPPGFAIDPAQPVERAATPFSAKRQVPPDCSLLTPAQRGGFLKWWSCGRPTIPDNPLVEAFCRVAFANYELRVLGGASDEQLLRAMGDLQTNHQGMLFRTGLSQTLNQAVQFAGYSKGVEHHLKAITWLRSLPGVPWGSTEVNMLLDGFFRAGVKIDGQIALLVGWAALTGDEQSVVSAKWDEHAPAFGHGFKRLYPAGMELTWPHATVSFVYTPSHPDVARALPAGMRLGFDLPDFFADGQFQPVLNLFRSVFGLPLVNNALAVVAPDATESFSESGTIESKTNFKEVVVRPAKPKMSTGESISSSSGNILDAARQKAAREQDDKQQATLAAIIGSVATDMQPGATSAASLLVALQAGNLPPELALAIHVGPPDTLIAIHKQIEALANGASAFNILTGNNSAGKTHGLDGAEAMALKRGLAVGRAELSPGCRLHGTNGEVRSLLGAFMRSLRLNGAPASKGLRHVLDTIKTKCQVAPEANREAWLKATQIACEPMLDLPGGAEMVEVISIYCVACAAGDPGMAAGA
ncbi:MAG: DUF2791 family P-loop domain-containing protein, partial [Verrucomicrobia bacterium]|nr:DUF2791 family P-loop domain-containing protein [Verrucomicrobiota bacterium]